MKISPNQQSSLVFFAGNFSLSIFRYLFHLLLLRLLLPNQYGEFLTFLSLIYLLSVPTNTLITVTTKTISSLFGKKDLASINGFFYFLFRKVFYPLFFLGIMIIISSRWLSLVFKANKTAFIVLGISTAFSTIQTICGAYLLGLHQFVKHTIFGLFSVMFTITLAVLLIHLHLGSLGAVIAQVFGGLFATIVALFWLKDYIFPHLKSQKTYDLSLKTLTGYSFLNSLSTISLISTDILLSRIILPPHQSGIYSSLSVIGRIIVFGLSPLSTLVLTYSAKKHATGADYIGLFKKIGLVVFLLGTFSALLFNFLPTLIVKVFSGSNFSESSQYLGFFAISMVLYSWSQFLLSFFNGTGREKYNLIITFFALIQPIVIFYFGKSVTDFTLISFYLQICLFVSLLLLLLKPMPTGAKINHGSS